MSDVLVIIPMFGKEEYTKKCIELTLKNAGTECDILVVDDGSPIPFRTRRKKNIDVLRIEKNTGFTNSVNQGILRALEAKWDWDCEPEYYDFIILLNNDTEPYPKFIKILKDAMLKDKKIGIAASSRKMITDSEYCIELFGEDLVRGHQRVVDQSIKLSDQIPCFWVPFCSVMLRMDMIREIGLLDKRMINWCSDNDYCIRAGFNDWKVVVVPESKVLHIHQVTTGSTFTKEGTARVSADQNVFLEKLTGLRYAEMMSIFPLDCEAKTYGKLSFSMRQE